MWNSDLLSHGSHGPASLPLDWLLPLQLFVTLILLLYPSLEALLLLSCLPEPDSPQLLHGCTRKYIDLGDQPIEIAVY
jgi:hypothetical protein